MLDLLTGLTLGAHLVSLHLPYGDYSSLNPGMYLRSDGGIVTGGYRNSFGRASFYAGYSWTHGPWSLTLGVVSGYKRASTITTTCWNLSPSLARNKDEVGEMRERCTTEVKRHPMPVAPLLAPSFTLPTVGEFVPRVTILPKLQAHSSTAVHFSLEHML